MKQKDLFKRLIKEISNQKLFKEKQHLYSAPLGFAPWKKILGHLFCFDMIFHDAMKSPNKCDGETSIAASYALHNDSPVRNISRNLGEAFLKTSTRGIIKPPIALEHFIINLPKGLLLDEFGQPLTALLVMTGDCFKKAGARRKVEVVIDEFDGLWTIGFCDSGDVLMDTTKWGNMAHEEEVTPQSIWFGVDENSKSKARAASQKMRQIAVHSLLTMAYKPELLSESKPSSSGTGFGSIGKHKQARNNVWIGEKFISKTRHRSQSDDREGSPLASHWRRGHWHTYLTGKKREKRSLKCNEPIHVNAAS